MSASVEESAIFTVDTPDDVQKKVMNAFTGGRETVKEQKKLGGTPEVCTVFQYFYFLFEPDDASLEERKNKCTNGDLLCGHCKKDLADRIVTYLTEHQKNREKARDVLDQFLLID
jgi:tryptophanyl-tRNA synthetase